MKLRAKLWNRQHGRCFYCDRKCHMAQQNGRPDPLMFTVDHVNRKYSPRLVVGACLECNHERGHIPAHEYIMIHADRLSKRIQKEQ